MLMEGDADGEMGISASRFFEDQTQKLKKDRQ